MAKRSVTPQPTRRKGKSSFWIFVARLITLIGMASNIVPTLMGLPTMLHKLQQDGAALLPDSWEASTLHSAALANGYSQEIWADTVVAADLLILVCYWSVAFLLFWRYSDRWVGWLVPYILTGLGVGTLLVDYWNSGLQFVAPGLVSIVEVIAVSIWPAFMASLFLFPDGQAVPRWTRYLLVLPALIFAATFLYDFNSDAEVPAILQVITFGILLAGVGSQIYRYFKASTVAQRQQTKWVLIALGILVVSFVLPTVLLRANLESSFWGTVVLAFLPRVLATMFLPIAMAISFTRYRLWDVDSLVNRALIYGALTTVLAAVFAASTVIVNQLLSSLIGQQSTSYSPVISAVLIATIFQPTRKWLEERIEKRFYPHKTDLSQGLVEVGSDFWGFIAQPDLLSASVRHVHEKLGATPVAIYAPDSKAILRRSELRGAAAASLPATLTLSTDTLKEFSNKHVDTLEAAGPFAALVPLYVAGRQTLELRGVLALGAKKDGRGYSGDELKALYELGGKIGLALLAVALRQTRKSAK